MKTYKAYLKEGILDLIRDIFIPLSDRDKFLYEEFSKYKNQSYYVHFSSTEYIKVTYDKQKYHDFTTATPYGIYAYPLDSLFKGSRLSIPYAGERKYVYLFKCDNILNLSNVDNNSLKSYLDRISAMFRLSEEEYDIMIKKINPFILTKYERENTLFVSKKAEYASKLLNFALYLSDYPNIDDTIIQNYDIKKWSNIFNDLGYHGILDEGYGSIAVTEKTQAVIFRLKYLKENIRITTKLPETSYELLLYMLWNSSKVTFSDGILYHKDEVLDLNKLGKNKFNAYVKKYSYDFKYFENDILFNTIRNYYNQ